MSLDSRIVMSENGYPNGATLLEVCSEVHMGTMGSSDIRKEDWDTKRKILIRAVRSWAAPSSEYDNAVLALIQTTLAESLIYGPQQYREPDSWFREGTT